MAATTAKTRQDVENQSARERLWDSLNYTYGQRGEELAQNYNQAISQSNNAMLKRGMQRSSYGAQINANLLHQKNKALAGNTSEMIAAYQDRLGQIEQQEQEQANWERTFAENQRQFNENLGFQKNQFNYQKERDVISDQQWQKTYDEQLRQFNENMAYQRERSNVSDAQWQKEYDEKLREFNENFSYQQSRDTVTDSQTDRAYYASWVQSIAANGGDASDDMLAKAGISRADFNAMKAEAAASGGGGGGGSYSSPTTPTKPGLNLDELNEDAGKNIWAGLNDSTDSNRRTTAKDRAKSSTSSTKKDIRLERVK